MNIYELMSCTMVCGAGGSKHFESTVWACQIMLGCSIGFRGILGKGRYTTVGVMERPIQAIGSRMFVLTMPPRSGRVSDEDGGMCQGYTWAKKSMHSCPAQVDTFRMGLTRKASLEQNAISNTRHVFSAIIGYRPPPTVWG